ncbi:hypothetical protein [Lysobacter sp. cf310]|uniref:hypothetical protein n=1 Tax=Lysobacter sp. cf310 TaxID=1761790 RepID=UPI0011137B90|nr:hypothetical protein [Lysobacter sp. cf310]
MEWDMDRSRALKLVISALLGLGGVAAAAAVTAQSYCTMGGCTVYGAPYPGGNWGIGAPGGGSSGAGGWGGGSSQQSGIPTGQGCEAWQIWGPGGCYDSNQQMCEALRQDVPEGCNVNAPPPVTMNGCGSAGTAGLVPDHLLAPHYVVYGPSTGTVDHTALVVAPFGAVFTSACNAHDACYGHWGADKATCDNSLRNDMVNGANSLIPSSELPRYSTYIQQQANWYSQGLQNPIVESFASNAAYQSAQKQGQCRAYRNLIDQYCN